MKYIRRVMLVSVLAAIISVSSLVLTPTKASAALFDGARESACGGVELSSDPKACDSGSGKQLNAVLTTVINIFSIVVGIAAVVMIIVGGFRYVTSGGDSNAVNGAKNTILYAIIGLVVVALAQFIVLFVLKKATTPPPEPAPNSGAMIRTV